MQHRKKNWNNLEKPNDQSVYHSLVESLTQQGYSAKKDFLAKRVWSAWEGDDVDDIKVTRVLSCLWEGACTLYLIPPECQRHHKKSSTTKTRYSWSMMTRRKIYFPHVREKEESVLNHWYVIRVSFDSLIEKKILSHHWMTTKQVNSWSPFIPRVKEKNSRLKLLHLRHFREKRRDKRVQRKRVQERRGINHWLIIIADKNREWQTRRYEIFNSNSQTQIKFISLLEFIDTVVSVVTLSLVCIFLPIDCSLFRQLTWHDTLKIETTWLWEDKLWLRGHNRHG
jgi:hypothetical protein